MPRDPSFKRLNLVGEKPYVAGWGSTTPGGESSKILQEVQVPVIAEPVCKDLYKSSKASIDGGVVCAGDTEKGGKDSCQGDSGGPLMLSHGPQSRVHLIGIVSFGIGCAQPNHPGVYTRVSHHIDWILSKLN